MDDIRRIREAFMDKDHEEMCVRHGGMPCPPPCHVPPVLPPLHLHPCHEKTEELDYTAQEINKRLGMLPGLHLLEVWGESDKNGLTQRFLTDAYKELRGDIDAIIADGSKVALAVSRQVVFAKEVVTMTATLTSTKEGELKLTRDDVQEVTGTGKQLSMDVSGTFGVGEIRFAGTATVKGVQKSQTTVVYAVLPIYYGTGAEWTDAMIRVNTPRRTPAGTYTMFPESGDYLFFVVPDGMNVSRVTMSGFDVPMATAVSVMKDGEAYKVYRTQNTYQAKELELVVHSA